MPKQVLSFRNSLEQFNKEQLIYVLASLNLCKEDEVKLIDALKEREREIWRQRIESAEHMKRECSRILEQRKGKMTRLEEESLREQIRNCDRRIEKYSHSKSTIERETKDGLHRE